MKMNKIVYCLVKLLIKNNPEKIRPLKMRTIARQPKILMKMRTIARQPKILMKMRTIAWQPKILMKMRTN